MNLVSRRHLIHVSQSEAISPTTSSSSIFHTHMHHSSTSFPIIAIAIIGIIATAILLVSYYIFVIKCCLNWHRIDLLRRFSPSRRTQDPSPILSQNTQQPRGLDEAMIRLIPVIQFKTAEEEEGKSENRDFCECAVCLNEFQQDEKLRIIPNCSHVFHIDCIDVWLQNNANCPLCRTSISLTTNNRYHIDQLFNLRPSTSSSNSNQDQIIQNQPIIGGDEDFVVIELSNLNERGNAAMELPKCPLEKKRRRLHKVTSMGDECIDIRATKDDLFSVQPIRRSFSMDSSGDRQFYLAVQEALQQQKREEVNCIEGCSGSSSGSGRVKKSFFSFGYGSRSRSSVQPVCLDP